MCDRIFRLLLTCGRLVSYRNVLFLLALASSAAQATPIYQPPGVNLVYGDLTHGYGALSASTNPAAAAVELGRAEKESTVYMMPSITAGIEYGNVQELFDFVDEISKSFKPSPPGTGARVVEIGNEEPTAPSSFASSPSAPRNT